MSELEPTGRLIYYRLLPGAETKFAFKPTVLGRGQNKILFELPNDDGTLDSRFYYYDDSFDDLTKVLKHRKNSGFKDFHHSLKSLTIKQIFDYDLEIFAFSEDKQFLEGMYLTDAFFKIASESVRHDVNKYIFKSYSMRYGWSTASSIYQDEGKSYMRSAITFHYMEVGVNKKDPQLIEIINTETPTSKMSMSEFSKREEKLASTDEIEEKGDGDKEEGEEAGSESTDKKRKSEKISEVEVGDKESGSAKVDGKSSTPGDDDESSAVTDVTKPSKKEKKTKEAKADESSGETEYYSNQTKLDGFSLTKQISIIAVYESALKYEGFSPGKTRKAFFDFVNEDKDKVMWVCMMAVFQAYSHIGNNISKLKKKRVSLTLSANVMKEVDALGIRKKAAKSDQLTLPRIIIAFLPMYLLYRRFLAKGLQEQTQSSIDVDYKDILFCGVPEIRGKDGYDSFHKEFSWFLHNAKVGKQVKMDDTTFLSNWNRWKLIAINGYNTDDYLHSFMKRALTFTAKKKEDGFKNFLRELKKLEDDSEEV